ncbi:MAG: methyltransferase domain-containing protein [Alphaproteobacteria bacterium]|nr:methyltransferase domain-containing protein [Alphaproteobacteria bacterium]
MADRIEVFDRQLLRQRRERAAATLPDYDFLFDEVADRLVDRLADIRRDFTSALDLGCHTGFVAKAAARLPAGKIGSLVQTDLSPRMAAVALADTGIAALAADEEALPFRDGSFDLILSCASLHHVNDLPGTLVQIQRALKPDGVFLAALFGGATLTELRQSWLAAESAIEGGAGPRVAPFADLRDAAGLLQRAGFALPVADTDTITVTYDNPLKLMADLRGMGETNMLLERRRTPTRRATLMAVAEQYMRQFAGADGRAPATFQILYLTGWAPADNQPQALRPGSATARLAEALDAPEHSAGEKSGPH